MWNAKDVAIWQTRLGYVPQEVVKKTLESTTQMIELEEDLTSYSVMRDHYKKRYPGLGCRRVQDYAFCDLFQPADGTGASKRGYKYYLLIALNRSKTVHDYGLKSKDQAPETLEDFF